MAHLFHVTLGNASYAAPDGSDPQTGYLANRNTGPFVTRWDAAWSTTTYAPVQDGAWRFDLVRGEQSCRHKQPYNLMLFAVHGGDVGTPLSVLPLPAAAWLLGSGLLVLAGASTQRGG